jgi:tripartite-type tricarboxylate transporter receptor subunit TctC
MNPDMRAARLFSVFLTNGAWLALTATQCAAQTQSYPSRPVRMIVANGPGSAPDVIARMLGAKLAESWGQNIIVDNRPGATGLIAVELLAKSAPDGHTLFLSTMTQLIAMLTYQKYLLHSELAPVTLVGTTPFAIVVAGTTPVKSISEWIAYAKARPGQLLYGSGGNWGSSHLCMESLNALTGLTMTHVPYANTASAFNDLIGGSIHTYCPAVPGLAPYTQSGRLRALGVTYRTPTKLLPGVPPVGDTVPGFELYGWYGMNVPLKTPPAIINKINFELVKALKDPQLTERMLVAGAEAVGSTPAEFTAFLNKNTEHWTKVLRDSGAKLGQMKP